MIFKNRLKALSLFANVGIAETYLADLGIDVAVANELIEERAKFYRHLYPSVNMIAGDITDDGTFQIIKELSVANKVDFLMATPPCQGMSCAGRKDPLDPRNFLIYYAIKMVKEINPRFVLFENVTMQQHTKIALHGKSVYIPEYVESELGDLYYFNEKRVVNAMNYGVPQSRQRYIYLLVRKDEGVCWEFPKENEHIITLNEAIGHLPSLDPLLREQSERWRFPDFEKKKEEGLKVSKWHYPPTHGWKNVEWMIHTPSGKSAFQNQTFFPQTKGRRVKGAPRTYMRMFWDKPATTVMQNSNVISAFSTVHPGRCITENEDDRLRVYSDPRALSIYELMIVSSLPANWNVPSNTPEAFLRSTIGEGIPPLFVKKLFNNLKREACIK